MPKASASPRQHPARRYRPARRARHHGIDIGIEPHVERAGGAGADRDAQQRGETDHRMQLPGRDHRGRPAP